MRAMFERLGLTFHRIRAADGSSLPQETVDEVNARNIWFRPLVRAEVGCLLSHRECWQRIAAGAEPFGAVFEDDVLLSQRTTALLQSSHWIPADASFIKLETRNRRITVRRRWTRISDEHQLAPLVSFHDGLAGYVVSRDCAAWLCAQIGEHVAPVDQVVLNPRFAVFGRIAPLQLIPAVCRPVQLDDRRSFASTINTDGMLYASDRVQGLDLNRGSGVGLRITKKLSAALGRLVRGQRRLRVPFR